MQRILATLKKQHLNDFVALCCPRKIGSRGQRYIYTICNGFYIVRSGRAGVGGKDMCIMGGEYICA